MFRKKYTRLPMTDGGAAKISLKGEALLCAVEAGLVQETADGNGYSIAPFLKFWDEFSLMLPKEIKEQPDDTKKVAKMVKEYRNQGADKQQ
jgi:hypothetical protein